MKDLLFKIRQNEVQGIRYGYLYNWYALDALDIPGWHVATEAEWTSLLGSAGATEQQRSNVLRSTRTAPDDHPRWDLPNTGALDTLTLSLLPGGATPFLSMGQYGYYWTATEYTSTTARYIRVSETGISVQTGGYNKYFGMSARLVKDDLTGYPNNGDEGTMTDRQGNVYRTKRVGSLVWTCENLATSQSDATKMIPHITDQSEWNSQTISAYCAYNNDESLALEYGTDTLEYSPDGWDDGILNLTRSKTLIGITRSYTVQLKFVKDGATILRDKFYTDGIDAKLQLEIWKLNRIDMIYERIYLGDFDFETFTDKDDLVEITTKNVSVSQLIKSNGDTIYDVSGSYTPTGENRVELYDAYLGVVPELEQGSMFAAKIQTVLERLVSAVAENRDLIYTTDFTALDDCEYYLVNGWAQFYEYPDIIIKTSLNTLLRSIFILTGLVLDIEVQGDTEKLVLKPLEDIYDTEAESYEIGDISNFSGRPDTDSAFNKIKAGYEKQDYEYQDVLNESVAFAGIKLEEVTSRKVDELDLVNPIRADLYELHYDTYTKIAETFAGELFPMEEFCIAHLIPETDPIYPGNPGYMPSPGTVRLGASGTEKDRPNTEITPRRLMLARLDYLSSLVNKSGAVFSFASGDYLLSELQTDAGSGYVAEATSITLTDPVYFKPFIFEFDAQIDETFFESMSQNASRPIEFNYKGNTYTGFLLDTKIKLHGKCKAHIKLLSSADNDLTNLIR